VDFDADGRMDVLTGSWPGQLYLFRCNADGSYNPGETIKDSEGEELKTQSASTVFATDWDADGDLDLLTGNIRGEVHLVTNQGNRKEPSYGKPLRLEISDELKDRRGDSGPIAADWDGDGLQDVLVGTGEGSVILFRNIGSTEKPELEGGKVLVEKSPVAWKWEDRKPGQWGARVKIHVTDWNGDGRLDLLLGDRSGSVIKNPQLNAEQREAAEEAGQQLAVLRKQMSEARSSIRKLESQVKDGGDDVAAKEKSLASLKEELDKLSETYVATKKLSEATQPTRQTRNGFVWLFLRKGSE